MRADAVIKASDQSVAASYAYDEFGNLVAGSGTLDQPYRFSTKRYYGDLGLNYYGYRFYSASLGRWMNRDPLGEEGGLNLYGFVGNGPMNAVDAWGLWHSDVHDGRDNYGDKYGTYYWSQLAGLTPDYAAIIADADINVDSELGKNWTPWFGDQSIHFDLNNSPGVDSRLKWADEQYIKAVELLKNGDIEGALRELGEGLHSLQDYYAHGDFCQGQSSVWELHDSYFDDWDHELRVKEAYWTEQSSLWYLRRFVDAMKSVNSTN